MPVRLPDIDDIRAAARRLEPVAHRTPLLENAVLNEIAGGRVLLKPESLQRTGSFKFRGAYNRLAQLPASERRAGVVAYSSGNHAQGVAAAARLLGIRATIVMPADAPAVKRERTRALGADIVDYERGSEDRAAVAAAIAARDGSLIVPPYDDPEVIAGQGTVGLEIAEEAPVLAPEGLDTVLICCGGGGLTAGCALALEAASPATDIVVVEPAGFDDMWRSIRKGERVANERESGSVCDALLPRMPGELTFAINRTRVRRGIAVTDDEALAAVAFAFRELRLVAEPGGAAALAAVLAGHVAADGRTVAVVLTGANIDEAVLSEALRR